MEIGECRRINEILVGRSVIWSQGRFRRDILLQHVCKGVVEGGEVPVVVLHGLLHQTDVTGVDEALDGSMANGSVLGFALRVHLHTFHPPHTHIAISTVQDPRNTPSLLGFAGAVKPYGQEGPFEVMGDVLLVELQANYIDGRQHSCRTWKQCLELQK